MSTASWWLVIALLVCLPLYAVAQDGPVFPGDKSSFVRDVDFKDGTKVKPGQEMTWTWEIKNSGEVSWKNRFLVASKANTENVDLKGIPKGKVPDTEPGEKCQIAIKLKAPSQTGSYRIEFKMVDKDGKVLFPNQQPVFKEFIVE